LHRQPRWRFVAGRFRLDADVQVPANAAIFLPPRSYTGQPLVELHLAGSPAVLEMALRAACKAGARLAGPGEFTARAFLSGRMSLLAAEAVAETIAARSDAQLVAARQLGDGSLAERFRELIDDLADLLSLVEAGIDFADEPIEFVDAATLTDRLRRLRGWLRDLADRSIDTGRLEALPTVGLLGPANGGKSTLMNRLSGLDRSICSPVPGTTRDVLSAVMDLPAGQVLLLDGPGLGSGRDGIDRLAQQQWRPRLRQIDLALMVLAADRLAEARNEAEREAYLADAAAAIDGQAFLVVLNKQDLLTARQRQGLLRWAEGRWPQKVYMVSALRGTGCDALTDAIGRTIGGSAGAGEGQIVLTARGRRAVAEAIEALDRAVGLAEEVRHTNDVSELIALYLREAIEQLGQITGEVTNEDLLERVFSRFCIGK